MAKTCIPCGMKYNGQASVTPNQRPSSAGVVRVHPPKPVQVHNEPKPAIHPK